MRTAGVQNGEPMAVYTAMPCSEVPQETFNDANSQVGPNPCVQLHTDILLQEAADEHSQADRQTLVSLNHSPCLVIFIATWLVPYASAISSPTPAHLPIILFDIQVPLY